MVKFTLEEVRQTITEHGSGDVLVSDQYTGNNITNLEIHCHLCQETYLTSFTLFRKNRRCHACFGKRYNLTKAKKIVSEGGDELLADKFINVNEKMSIKCNRCQQIYQMDLHHYLSGNRCRDCGHKTQAKKRLKYNLEIVRQYVQEQGEFLISDEFVNVITKLDIQCKKCNQVYQVNFDGYKSGTRCGKCCKNALKSYEQIKHTINSSGDLLLTEQEHYKTIRSPIQIQCGQCQKIYDTTYCVFSKSRKLGRICLTCFPPQKRYTYEEVKQIVIDGGEELVSQEWVNYDTKIQIRCQTCQEIYSIRIDGFKKGNRCEKCGYKRMGEKRRLDYEYVKNIIEATGEKLLSETYRSNKTKLEILCQKCQKPYYLDLCHFRKSIRCGSCHGWKTLTYDYVKEYIENDGNILISQEYKNIYQELEIQCGQCQDIFFRKFVNYRSGTNCTSCIKTRRRLAYDKVKHAIQKGGDNLISKEYKNCNTKLDIKCGDCNNIYQMTLGNYKSGYRCFRCAPKKISIALKHDIIYIEKFLSVNNDILISKEYNGVDKPIEFICHKCNEIHSTSLTYYKKGYNCDPVKSKGEIFVENYLVENNYKYEYQKRYLDCRYIRPLPFDFYIEHKNIKFLIEFHGRQHYEVVRLFGGEKGFIERQKRDEVKEKYCSDKLIPLLIIPYWDIKNIPLIIDKFISDTFS